MDMNKEEIESQIKAAGDSFDSLQRQRDEIDLEMAKLQGEYRAYTVLLEKLKKEVKDATATKQ